MTEVAGDATRLTDAVPESALDAVRQAVLDLLDALPHRPDRLRLQAAEVSVDVDWRTLATPIEVLPADGPRQVTGGAPERPPSRAQEQPAGEDRPVG
jgi:hypothetical protein